MLDFEVKRSKTNVEFAELLFATSNILLVSDEQKYINFHISIQKFKRNYIGKLTIQYNLHNQSTDDFFNYWDKRVIKIVKSTKNVSQSPSQNKEVYEYEVRKSMEEYLSRQMKEIIDLYYTELELLSDEEKELLLENHVVNSNLMTYSYCRQLESNFDSLIESETTSDRLVLNFSDI